MLLKSLELILEEVPLQYLMIIAVIITSLMSLLSHHPHIIDSAQKFSAAASSGRRTRFTLRFLAAPHFFFIWLRHKKKIHKGLKVDGEDV